MGFKVSVGLLTLAVLAGTMVLFSGGATTAEATPVEDFCGTEELDIPDSGDVFDFGEACAAHDECYYYGGDEYDRYVCDRNFYYAMQESCSEMWDRFQREYWQCRSIARTYYLGVRFGGFLYFNYGGIVCSTSVGTTGC